MLPSGKRLLHHTSPRARFCFASQLYRQLDGGVDNAHGMSSSHFLPLQVDLVMDRPPSHRAVVIARETGHLGFSCFFCLFYFVLFLFYFFLC